MLTIERNQAQLAFSAIHEKAKISIAFERTLRVPDDGRDYPLPPGLGEFPIRSTPGSRVASTWQTAQSVMLPMWPSEAMWIMLTYDGYPCAIKVGTSGVNALTGELLTPNLNDPQDYVVAPNQPWLDGYVVAAGIVRQFVATDPGSGRSVAEQIAAEPAITSLRLMFFPMTPEQYRWRERHSGKSTGMSKPLAIAAGGKIKQEVYCDTFGIDAWVKMPTAMLDVYLVPASTWRQLTGEQPPARPPTAHGYTEAGLPWFEYYSPEDRPISARPSLASVNSSVTATAVAACGDGVPPAQIVQLGMRNA